MYYYQNIFISIDTIFPILALVTVALRFQARKAQKQSLSADDWVILTALIITLAGSIGCLYAIFVYNFANLILSLTPDQTVYSFKFLYYDVILFTLTLGLIKVSVILFYKRIFTTRAFKITANIFIGICSAWTIAGVLSAIFRDNPISNYWEHEAETSYDFGAWNIAMAVLDIVLDLAILSLPLPVIRGLQISARRKASVAAIFLLGIFCVISSAVRLYYARYLAVVADSLVFIIENPEAATYITNSATLWSHIECSVSIITACLPTLVPLAKRFQVASHAFRSWLSKTSSRRSDSGYTSNGPTDLTHNGNAQSFTDYNSSSTTELQSKIRVVQAYTVSSV